MSKRVVLFIDLVVCLLCAGGIYRVAERAELPYAFESIASLDGQRTNGGDELRYILDQKNIGQRVTVGNNEVNAIVPHEVTLVPASSLRSVVIDAFATAVFLFIGIFVFLRLPSDPAARNFHHLAIAIAGTIALTTGSFNVFGGFGRALEYFFYAAYVATPIFFIRFCNRFPRRESRMHRSEKWVAAVGAVVFAFASGCFLLLGLDRATFEIGLIALDIIRAFFAISFFAGLAILFRSYRKARSNSERVQLRWIFFGISIGALTFIVFYQLPLLILGRAILPEDLVIVLSVVAPISFAIAIVKYRAFDIDLLIKRTTMYATALTIVFVLYVGLVALLTEVISGVIQSASVRAMIAGVVIALIFEPLRKLVQRSVDRIFFRSEFDLKKEMSELMLRMKEIYSIPELATFVVDKVDRIIPVERIGFFTLEDSGKLKLQAHHGFDLLAERHVQFQSDQLKTDLSQPVMLASLAPAGADVEAADAHVFRRWGVAAAFPMKSGDSVSGFIVLGARRSQGRFTIDDLELLSAASLQSSLATERIRLHEALIIEQAESERLAELSRLKTYFVSSVSHDLKTPLTSIAMFAELLQTNTSLDRAKQHEYLAIIEGETRRLSRLINGVLDFANIERGKQKLHFERVDVNEVVRQALQILEYQFKMGGFQVSVRMSESPLCVHADSDALTDVAINLLSNAMKYSTERKMITIDTFARQNNAILSVRDAGIGMAPGELTHIFEDFYRVPDASSAGGAGLGLSIVKHTIDAHGGSVEVESEPGVGSLFRIALPLIQVV